MSEPRQGYTDGSRILLHDGLDVARYDNAAATYDGLQDAISRAAAGFDTAPALAESIFFALNRTAAVDDGLETPPAFTLNEIAVKQMLQTEQYQQLHSRTNANDFLAAMATATLIEKVVGAIDPTAKQAANELAEISREIEELERDVATTERLQDAAAYLGDQRRVERLQARADSNRAAILSQQQEAATAAAALRAQEEKIADDVRLALRAALADTRNEVEETDGAIRLLSGGGWGSGPGDMSGRTTSMREQLKIAKLWKQNRQLQQILALAGKMHAQMEKVRQTSIKHEQTYVVGLKLGDDLRQITAGELAAMVLPELSDDWMRRYAGRELLQYELRGKRRLGRGPLIITIDVSGSMSGYPDIWAKACAITMMTVARLEKRDFCVIIYSSRGEMECYDFPLGQIDTARMVEMATKFYGGGTHFEQWMAEAEKRVSGNKWNMADVIAITDGCAGVTAAWVARWQKMRQMKETTVYGIQIGSDYFSAELMATICDSVTVQALTQADQVQEMVFAI